MDDLAPKIKELRARQEELEKCLTGMRAELERSSVTRVDTEAVKAYASDLRTLLTEVEATRRKAILRSFIEKIILSEETGKI